MLTRVTWTLALALTWTLTLMLIRVTWTLALALTWTLTLTLTLTLSRCARLAAAARRDRRGGRPGQG